MKLAITQIVLGIFVIGLLVLYIGWVEPDYGPINKLFEGIEVELDHPTGWTTLLMTWKVSSLVLGVAVLGCGIVQYLQARGQAMG